MQQAETMFRTTHRWLLGRVLGASPALAGPPPALRSFAAAPARLVLARP
jgi:hypothetical protein